MWRWRLLTVELKKGSKAWLCQKKKERKERRCGAGEMITFVTFPPYIPFTCGVLSLCFKSTAAAASSHSTAAVALAATVANALASSYSYTSRFSLLLANSRIINIIIIYSFRVFPSALTDGFTLEFEWQQVSPSLQDSSQDSGRS